MSSMLLIIVYNCSAANRINNQLDNTDHSFITHNQLGRLYFTLVFRLQVIVLLIEFMIDNIIHNNCMLCKQSQNTTQKVGE